MPTLKLFTNIPVDPVTISDILKDPTKTVAKIIGKPESYVLILVNGGVPIAFAGTEEPAAFAEIISIGGLGPTVNGKLSSTLADILQEKLSIQSSRFYIKFYDVEVRESRYELYSCIGKTSRDLYEQLLRAPSSASMARRSDRLQTEGIQTDRHCVCVGRTG